MRKRYRNMSRVVGCTRPLSNISQGWVVYEVLSKKPIHCQQCQRQLEVGERFIRKSFIKSDARTLPICQQCEGFDILLQTPAQAQTQSTAEKPKLCLSCGHVKARTAFNKLTKSKDGLDRRCRSCEHEYKQYHRDRINTRRKVLYGRHKKKERELARRRQFPHRAENATRSHIWRVRFPERSWAQTTAYRHRERGHVLELSNKELEDLAKRTTSCPICGVALNYQYGKGWLSSQSPTLDRLNNGRLMTRDSVWIICHKCNATKNARSMSEFVAYCRNVVERFGSAQNIIMEIVK